MKRILLATVTVLAMSSFAYAEPVQLSAVQMDSVTAAGTKVTRVVKKVNVVVVRQVGPAETRKEEVKAAAAKIRSALRSVHLSNPRTLLSLQRGLPGI